MTYSDEDIARMDAHNREWRDRWDDIETQYLTREYRHDQTREFVSHGFSRRMSTLLHCQDRVFELVGPNEPNPDRDKLMDATALIHAFYINLFGAFDNLAHVWVREARVTLANGQPLPRTFIGFGQKNQAVRASVSPRFAGYLNSARHAAWIDYLEDYRHSLAHRIPLYIPPRRLNDQQAEEFRRLEDEIAQAYRDRRFDDLVFIRGRQASLGVFEPVIMHSYEENARPVRFHGQLGNDFSTIVQFAEHFITELDDLPAHAI
jgi:hypothetical protein